MRLGNPAAPRENGAVFVYNKTRETFLAYQVTIADSTLSRLVGLLGKRSLDPETGLWIVPSCGVHTLGMRFPIDVIFLNEELRVIYLCESVRPFSMTRLCLQAKSVLELAVHTNFKSRTEIGDNLILAPFDAAGSGKTGELPAKAAKTSRSETNSVLRKVGRDRRFLHPVDGEKIHGR